MSEKDDRRMVSLRVRKVDKMEGDTIYVNFDMVEEGFLYNSKGNVKLEPIRNIVTANAASNISFKSLASSKERGLYLSSFIEACTKGHMVGPTYHAFIPADAFVDHLAGYNDARIDSSELIRETIPAYKQVGIIKRIAEMGPW